MSANPSENLSLNLTAAVEQISDSFLHCRGIQHVWNITMDMHITERTTEGHMVERHMVCGECETLRKDRFLLRQDRWGVNRLEVLHPTYTYPEGYLMAEMRSADHPREIVRFELLTRALGGKAKVNRALTKAQQNVE